jgi:preprotein translocase subunit YajC
VRLARADKEGELVVFATEQTGSGGGGLLTFLPIILLVVLMYFLMIRPQSKRRREAQEMQSRLGLGDEVQTVGGLFGVVIDIDDEAITLEPSPGVAMRFARGAIARVVNKQPTEEDAADDEEETGTDSAKAND